MQKFISCLVMLVLCSLSTSSWSAMSAKQFIEQGSSELLTVVENNKDKYSNNPDAVISSVRVVLDNYMDYDFIIKRVMGSQAYKAATISQKKIFKKNFVHSIVSTFTRGLILLGDVQSEVTEHPSKKSKDVIRVSQQIKSKNNAINIDYIVLRKDNSWRVVNVYFSNINLGKLYRDQFKNMRKKYDLDRVINEWR